MFRLDRGKKLPAFLLARRKTIEVATENLPEIEAFEAGSRGRTRTYNHTVNSRVLYH
jgi:hypothetical protein